MKHLRILPVLLALTICLSGCGDLLSLLSQLDTTDCYDSQLYLQEFETNWQYSLLDSELQSYYGSLYTAVSETYATDSTIEFTDEKNNSQIVAGVRVRFPGAKLSENDITVLYEALSRDNPHLFYLDRIYRMEGRKNKDGDPYYDTMLLHYRFTPQERVTYTNELTTATEKILKDLPKEKDLYFTELTLHDRLVAGCTYDTDAAADTENSDVMAYTAYGALVEGSAVCEGYARAMQLLLNRAGIATTVINGTSVETKESHMWNLVSLNGNYYYLDPTWNDNQDKGYHTYFNITSSDLLETHIIAPNQAVAISCTATVDNYFIRNNTYIDTYHRQTIAEIIAKCVRNGDTTIQLKFAPDKFSNGLLFLKNGTLTFELVNEQLEQHHLTLWDYVLWIDKETNTLTLTKGE